MYSVFLSPSRHTTSRLTSARAPRPGLGPGETERGPAAQFGRAPPRARRRTARLSPNPHPVGNPGRGRDRARVDGRRAAVQIRPGPLFRRKAGAVGGRTIKHYADQDTPAARCTTTRRRARGERIA